LKSKTKDHKQKGLSISLKTTEDAINSFLQSKQTLFYALHNLYQFMVLQRRTHPV